MKIWTFAFPNNQPQFNYSCLDCTSGIENRKYEREDNPSIAYIWPWPTIKYKNIKITKILKVIFTIIYTARKYWMIRGTFGLCWMDIDNNLFGVEILLVKKSINCIHYKQFGKSILIQSICETKDSLHWICFQFNSFWQMPTKCFVFL